ncbi:MAG: hypothetical protein AAGN35_24125 [Bacteroidota bacterium]
MKNTILSLLAVLIFSSGPAQTTSAPTPKGPGWFFAPEFSLMFLEDHVGNAVGASIGASLWKRRIKVGLMAYGRSGPINRFTYTVTPSDNQMYQGRDQVTLRSDHGAFGVMVAPTFHLKNFEINVPIMAGMIGAGYYLFGDDRNTPDGRRVSDWENQLLDGRDAGFGTVIEGGVRFLAPLGPQGMRIGAGLHYTTTQGWETYVDPSGETYHNRIRLSLLVQFSDQ